MTEQGMPPPVMLDEDALLCPRCGYDLRGTESARCSECGCEIDRANLSASAIPWVYRGSIGRVKAFVKTVWLFTMDRGPVRREVMRNQSAADARVFWRIVAAAVAVVLVGVFGVILLSPDGLKSLVFEVGPTSQQHAGLDEELRIAWSAGVGRAMALPLGLIVWAVWATSAPRLIPRILRIDEAQRARAEALMLYAAAPMALLLPGVVVYGSLLWLEPPLDRMGWFAVGLAGTLIAACGMVLCAAGILLPVVRVGQWVARLRRSALAGWSVVLLLPGLWLVAAVVAVGIFPACVGFLWIVIDSFR